MDHRPACWLKPVFGNRFGCQIGLFDSLDLDAISTFGVVILWFHTLNSWLNRVESSQRECLEQPRPIKLITLQCFRFAIDEISEFTLCWCNRMAHFILVLLLVLKKYFGANLQIVFSKKFLHYLHSCLSTKDFISPRAFVSKNSLEMHTSYYNRNTLILIKMMSTQLADASMILKTLKPFRRIFAILLYCSITS